MYDADGRIILFNERYRKMIGLPAASLRGRTLLDLLHQRKASGEFDGDPEAYFAQLVENVREGKPSSHALEIADGRTLRVVDRPMKRGGWVATLEDITDWREAQAQIEHMARHDALTDLPNRRLFHEQLEQALRRLARNNERLTILCIDLDNFKDVNDCLGHPLGDDLLKEVAHRLSKCVRKSDLVARLGGDEFAILREGGSAQLAEASALATRLVEVVDAPYEIDGQHVVIGASVGISIAPGDGSEPDQLLKSADLALYRAKAEGKGRYRFFEPEMDARAQARRRLLLDLRVALLRDEFEVYYQPIYDLHEPGRIVCCEALLRWHHPVNGLTQPAEFIPLAEETGLIVPIGDLVLRKACAEAATWSQDVGVAVNLSPAQLRNRNLASSVLAALSTSGLAANRLEPEITEAVLLQDTEETLATLRKVHEFGVRISMDDFGTGYSSLSYLRSFPFDKIKIDQSFVRDLSSRPDSIAIVRAILSLGKSLGVETTGEGVETSEQLALLSSEGCTQAQGFFFSEPLRAAELKHMLFGAGLLPPVAYAEETAAIARDRTSEAAGTGL